MKTKDQNLLDRGHSNRVMSRGADFVKTDAIRQSYLDFFNSKGHKIVASDSLVPENDPTLLFTGAGMNQFKEYFLGLKKDMKRATSSQKCLRTGDLDNVGKTAFHHSFFEMLGNFSFGDYFKEEAIDWAWEYLTAVLKISPERLRISVHHTDHEAFKIWQDKIKIREDWIYKLGDDSNFWPANAPKDGPNGPCGPCSEIYYDLGKECARPGEDVEHIESKRFAEIWNLVFTQFDRQDVDKLEPLKNKNIDTGMGLERLASVLQGKKTNFDIDIFQPIHESIQKALKIRYTSAEAGSLNAIADHARAVVFSIADGVIPSNDGRGYVIRKLIRRSLWHAHQVVPGKRLGEPFLYKVVEAVVRAMAGGYPELREAEKSIETTLKGEEERFLDTLETGVKILNQKLGEFKKAGNKVLPGEFVFELYDTYGFPDELTRTIAEDEGFAIDQNEFESLMAKQRDRAKQASQIADAIFVSTELEKKILTLPATKFTGYEELKAEGKVLLADIHDQKGIVVLDVSPFYGESGGQVGDVGYLEGDKVSARVVDAQKKDKVIIHCVEIEKGNFREGETVKAVVDAARRSRIMRNHTATHLLHTALRTVLGKQVRQLGSMVSPEKLRFDYSYAQALTDAQIKEVEDLVNQEILKDTALEKTEQPIAKAKEEGAIAFFGEKYGDKVRVITVPGFSKELCGGTHCDRTGQIGACVILSESSVASGTRRIEALTGEGALEYIRTLRTQMTELADELKTTPSEMRERIRKLKDSMKKMEKAQSQAQPKDIDARKIAENAVTAGAFRFAYFSARNLDAQELRRVSDVLRTENQGLIYLLGSEGNDKVQFLLGMSQDLLKSHLDLRELMRELSSLLGVTGGGRKDMVQGGGPNQGQLADKRQAVLDTAQAFLSKK